MKIESRIHCGHVVSSRSSNGAVFTETRHDANSRLTVHAHSSSHLAILLTGSYFERIGENCFLRLPGDRVFYPRLLEHENRFGQISSTCLNIEKEGELSQEEPRHNVVSKLAGSIHNLALTHQIDSLSSAAQLLGYHPVYVSRVFRKAYGQSLGDFIKSCRIRKCSDLIFRSDMTLGQIAADAGYYDQSHLTNELSATAGFTPGELRRLAGN